MPAASHTDPIDSSAARPVVRGTDIKVSQIASEAEHNSMTPEQIVRAHPHLTLAQVHAALAFYRDNRAPIHREWQEATTLITELKVLFPSRLPPGR